MRLSTATICTTLTFFFSFVYTIRVCPFLFGWIPTVFTRTYAGRDSKGNHAIFFFFFSGATVSSCLKIMFVKKKEDASLGGYFLVV